MTTTTADIQKYEISAEGNIVYFIKVVYNGREWAVRKRYSDFSRLDEFLQRDGFDLSYALPSKQFWKTFDKKTLMERQKGLQSYLNTLLKSTVSSDNSLVKEFLDVDHNRLQHARKQSFHALKRTERMESVVNIMSRSVIYIPVKNTNMVFNNSAAVTRDRQGSQAVNRDRNNSNAPISPHFGSGPSMQKAKSLSFSMKFSFSAGSRKNSFQPDNRTSFAVMERKQSVQGSVQAETSNKSSSVDVATLKDLLKKEAFEYGVNALWNRYEIETNQILNESDYLYNVHGVNSKDGRRSALPQSYYRVKSSTDSPAASQHRKSHASLLACMAGPINNRGDDSLEMFLDSKLRSKTKSFIDKFGDLTSPEDRQAAQDALNFVNYQRKYEVLVYLVDDYLTADLAALQMDSKPV